MNFKVIKQYLELKKEYRNIEKTEDLIDDFVKTAYKELYETTKSFIKKKKTLVDAKIKIIEKKNPKIDKFINLYGFSLSDFDSSKTGSYKVFMLDFLMSNRPKMLERMIDNFESKDYHEDATITEDCVIKI